MEGKVDWKSESTEDVRTRMEQLMLSAHPNLRRCAGLFNMVHQERLCQGESILQLIHRVEAAMKLGGVGTKAAFSLGYDSLLITIIVALSPRTPKLSCMRDSNLMCFP